MKPLPYEAILTFEEAIIREFFPRGVIQVGKGDRWEPAEKKADRTLARLLRDKRDRQEKPKFMHSDASKPATDNIELGVGYRTGKTRNKAGFREEPEPQQVDDETELRFARDAEAKRNTQRGDELIDMQAKIIANKIAKVQREGMKCGVDLAPRLMRLLKEAQGEIVQQRRSAAFRLTIR